LAGNRGGALSEETFSGAIWLIDAIKRDLAGMGGEGVSIALSRLAEQDLSASAFREPEPDTLPACAWLAETIAATMMVSSSVSAAMAEVAPHLRWKQNANYSDELLGEGYMASYAYSEFIGPDGFFPGDDFLMGILLLGPNRTYKDHVHPAPELYWTLTGPSLWRCAPGGFEMRPAGTPIWHAPNVVHATHTIEQPLLAVWIWTEDTQHPARLVTV
jgi:hypothetical protein